MIEFLKDNNGQGAAEYALLIGGIIVIVIAAILIYQGYVNDNIIPGIDSDAESLTKNITDLTEKFK